MITVAEIRNCTDFRTAVQLCNLRTGISLDELGNQIGYKHAQIYNLIAGKAPVSPKLCFGLEKVFNIEAKFWWDLYWDTYYKEKESE